MRKTILILVILLSLLSTAHGDELRWQRRWLVEPRAPLSNRVAIVLDTSGSMLGAPIAVGRAEVLNLLGFATDGTYVRLYAFADEAQCFGDWAMLPDADVTAAVDGWLGRFTGTGDTDISGALTTVLMQNEQDDLTVVLVTDGEPSGSTTEHLEAIEAAQMKRSTRAMIHVIGICERESEGAEAFFAAVAKHHQGGALVWRPKVVTLR